MTQFKYKTSIKCNGCIEKVGPELNATHGIEKWEVDLTHPDRILTVEFQSDSDEAILNSVRKAGFQISAL
jgi:copper chaperone